MFPLCDACGQILLHTFCQQSSTTVLATSVVTSVFFIKATRTAPVISSSPRTSILLASTSSGFTLMVSGRFSISRRKRLNVPAESSCTMSFCFCSQTSSHCFKRPRGFMFNRIPNRCLSGATPLPFQSTISSLGWRVARSFSGILLIPLGIKFCKFCQPPLSLLLSNLARNLIPNLLC